MRLRLILSAMVVSHALGGPASAESPGASPSAVASASAGEAALAEALVAMSAGMHVIEADPETALASCRDAWADLQRAVTAGALGTSVIPVERLVRTCLDRLHEVRQLDARLIQPAGDLQLTGLAVNREGVAFLLDGATGSVWRSELDSGRSQPIVEPGDGHGAGIGQARTLSSAGDDLVILDDHDHLWRWRDAAHQRLRLLRSPALPGMPDDALAMTTYVIDSDRDIYNAYVVDQAESQVWRLEPALDRPGFSALSDYLVKEEDLTAVQGIVVDQSLYLLTPDGLRRYYAGRPQVFELATPPDDVDLRPGHDYRHVTMSGDRFLVYDARWDRIIAFDRTTGDYLGQWASDDPSTPLADVAAIAVADPIRGGSPLVWITPTGLATADLS